MHCGRVGFWLIGAVCSIANNRVLTQQPQVFLNTPSRASLQAPAVPPPTDATETIRETTQALNNAVGPTRESLLRDKAAFPRGLKTEFGRRGGIDAGMLREITAIREARKTRHPVENRPLEDQTVDQSGDRYLQLEAGATVVDFAADLVPIIAGNSTGIEAFSGEIAGASVGALPELYLLVSKCLEIKSGKIRLSSAVETVQTLDKLLGDLEHFRSGNHERIPPLDDQKLTTLESRITKLRDGLEATIELNTRVVKEARTERKHILAGLGGGALELGSATALTAGEQTAKTALTTTGASLGLIAGPLSMYFTGKMIKEEVQNTGTYRENQTAALTALENNPGYRTASSAGEAESLTRALSKMAAERSPVNESRFKTGLFATGMLTTLAGTVQSGLLLGGASVAAAAATVGFVAIGLGVVAFLGFVGYGVYKLATSKASSTKELQKAAFHSQDVGNPPKKLLELARVQGLKTKNDITSVVLRERLRVALPKILASDDKKSELRRELEKAGGTFADELADRILENLPSQAMVDAEFVIQQNPYADPDPAFRPRSREEVFQSLLDQSIDRTLGSFVALKNKAHVSLVDDQSWKSMISEEIATGSSARVQDALSRALPLPCELPPPDLVVATVQDCKAAFLQIEPHSNPIDSMRRILSNELATTCSRDTADRLANVVTANLFPRIDSVESLQNLDQILKDSSDLKSDIARSNSNAFEDSLRESSVEMGKLAAARKLLRRDPEMLLYTIIDAIQRADGERRDADSLRLRGELQKYGVSPETLSTALKAESINQRLDAAGLLAKSLNFL